MLRFTFILLPLIVNVKGQGNIGCYDISNVRENKVHMPPSFRLCPPPIQLRTFARPSFIPAPLRNVQPAPICVPEQISNTPDAVQFWPPYPDAESVPKCNPALVPVRRIVPNPIFDSEPNLRSVAIPTPVLEDRLPKSTENLIKNFNCYNGNGYYPVEDNCDTFIECKESTPIRYACPDGLHFNPTAKSYEYPCNSEVRCKGTTTQVVPKQNDLCPQRHGLFAIEGGDCSKYITCQEGAATIKNCPAGLAFNQETTTCDWPTNVPQCSRNEVVPKQNNLCPQRHGLFAIEGGDCSKYITCQEGAATIKNCPAGLAFNQKTTTCDWPTNVPQCSRYEVVPKQNNLCPQRHGLFAIEGGDCSKYITCQEGAATIKNCPAGLAFNQETTTCDWPTNVPQCSRNEVVPKQNNLCPQRHGLFAIEGGDCSKYITCQEGAATIKNCPAGLAFNQETTTCDWPTNVPQCSRNEVVPKQNNLCPQRHGLFAIEGGDCSKYITCQEGAATIKNCPAGLAFNQETTTCDWPTNVPQCSRNVLKDFTCPPPPVHDVNVVTKHRYKQQCQQYVACHVGYPRLQSCEPGLVFSEVSQACVDKHYVPDCSEASL